MKSLSQSHQNNCFYQKNHKSNKCLIDRFWPKINKTETCWLWTATVQSDGYGMIKTVSLTDKINRMRLAHRVSYEISFGEIPSGLLVLHKCDNPPCVNPDHLFLGTDKANAIDRDKKNRHRGPVAENKIKTHCIHGHEFTKENTYLYGENLTHRSCRICRRESYVPIPKKINLFCKKGHRLTLDNIRIRMNRPTGEDNCLTCYKDASIRGNLKAKVLRKSRKANA